MQELTMEKGEEWKAVLSGEIDAENSDEFYSEFAALYATDPKDVVFECSRLGFIDSTTLGTFVKILKKVRADGHRVRLTGLKPQLKKLFVICSLDTIMEIAE